jgi:predicted cytidylate kinase
LAKSEARKREVTFMHITITGNLGSGKSTYCRLLNEKYQFEVYSTGKVQRELARQMNMTTLELNQLMCSDKKYDNMIDDATTKISRENKDKDIIFDSRLAWHFVEHSFKVFVSVSLEVAAERVMNDQRGAEEKYSSLEEAKKLLAERAATERVRYKDIYNLNYMDFSNYNLVIDSTFCSPDKIVEIILKEANEFYQNANQPETTKLWQRFRDLSLKEFSEVYKTLNIEFDSYAGESFYSDKMDEVVQILKDKHLLKDSEGAKIVDLEKLGLPPIMILKSNGTTIYATRDLAAAIYRKRTYDFYKNIYVVGGTQALHFKQIFSTLGLMGFDWGKNCVHVSTSLVKFADKKLSTRKGDVIFAKDVINEAIHKTTEVIDKKNPNLENKAEVAKKVGIGALLYTFLKNNREKDVVFTWEDALNFDGDSGPYVQYTYVRGKSIVRKAGIYLKPPI